MGKRLMCIGCLLVVILTAGLVIYQKAVDSHRVDPFHLTEDMDRAETSEGYENPEDLVKYMICQIQNADLDLALRGCAIENLAEYFVLESYLELTDEFKGLEDLPPSETESEAYIGISTARLAGYYADMVEKCMELFGSGHEVQLVSVEEYVPENPDGMYYQLRQKVCEALGCRTVSEMRVLLNIDGDAKEMYWTLVRYRSKWNVLAFNELEKADQKSVEIRSVSAAESDGKDIINYNTDDVLPLNYKLVNQNKEDTPEDLLENLISYLRREDVWSAMSYFHLYDTGQNRYIDQELLKSQEELAGQMQIFYYQLFIPNREKFEWYQRETADRGDDLAEDLKAEQIVSLTVDWIREISQDADGHAQYQMSYSYSGRSYVLNLELVNVNGWMIESMEWEQEIWLN